MKKLMLTGLLSLLGYIAVAQNQSGVIGHPPPKAKKKPVLLCGFDPTDLWVIGMASPKTCTPNNSTLCATMNPLAMIGLYYMIMTPYYSEGTQDVAQQTPEAQKGLATLPRPLTTDHHGSSWSGQCLEISTGNAYAHPPDRATHPNK